MKKSCLFRKRDKEPATDDKRVDVRPWPERYRFTSRFGHGLTKRPTKSSRRLGCLYYYIYIAPGEIRYMVVTLLPFLNRLDRETEKANQINSWRTSGLNQKCYLNVVVPKHTRFLSRKVLAKIIKRQESNSELATVIT